MRFLGPFVLMLLMSSPALAERSGDGFPFQTGAGAYRDLVVYPDDARSVRLVFPVVAVERPGPDRAILRPGGGGRVIVQLPTGRKNGFATTATLSFGDAPITLRRNGDRLDLEGSLRAIALPLMGGSDPAVGTIAFEAMRAVLSVPMGTSPAIRQATITLKARAMRVDAAMLALPAAANPAPFGTGPIDLSGRVSLRIIEDPADLHDVARAIRRIDLDRASVVMLDGRVDAAGAAVFSPAGDGALRDLRGNLSLGNYAGMIQRLLASKVVAPQQLMPLVLMAASLGRMSTDGTLSFRVATGADGALIINGKPTALTLAP